MAWTAANRYLTQAEMEGNAREIVKYARQENWSKTALAAILGNMQAESGINPGIWENLTPYAGGYGLVQWTPYTKLEQWAEEEGLTWLDDGDTQLLRISYEAQNNIQWFRNEELGIDPPISFEEFLHDDNYSRDDMTNFWLWFYEHPADPGPTTQQQRQTYAEFWWDFIGAYGQLPIWLLFKIRERWN